MLLQVCTTTSSLLRHCRWCKLGVTLLLLTPVAKQSQSQKFMSFKALGFCVYRLRQKLQCVKGLSCWCCNLGAGKDSRVSSLSMSSWIENQGTRSFLVLLVTLGCLKSEIEELLRALQCVLSSGGMCFPGKPCSLPLGCPAGSRARILCSLEV